MSKMSDKDIIYRQAAIDALANYIHNLDKLIGTGRLSTYDCEYAATSVFADLPSAQSEIIRCKDCKWHNREINQCNAQICASMRSEDFCSKAERQEE